MTFLPVPNELPPPESPLTLFDELPRMPGAVPELWRQQGEILTAYAERFTAEPDVAVELPTGTGKTMVGLLTSEWRRRQHRRPVLYACPTQQLAHQVAAVAAREGIRASTLVGSHKAWIETDRDRYLSADAIGITTYSSIFNSLPKVGAPGTIVFDDAHAAEQYVADAWTVRIARKQLPAVYSTLLTALQPGLGEMFYGRLQSSTPDLGAAGEVRIVVPLRRPHVGAAVRSALEGLEEFSEPWWAMKAISPGLESCLVYVSWHEIMVRPFIPPTAENKPFTDASQRLYLSATLGSAGELERSFGRSRIARLPLADGRRPRSGRRFFIFGDLADGDPDDLATQISAAAGKTLVLATSTERAQQVASDMNPLHWPIFGKDEIETDLKAFADEPNALLALAGRYDGIDLPDDACRLVCFEGLPEWVHLQERFLASSVRARIALEERTRTRVVQGTGRATRNPLDHAVVLVRGKDLTQYLMSPVVREALDPDLQSEVEFGLTNSREVDHSVLLENVAVFLSQGEQWRTGAEPHLADVRRRAKQMTPKGSNELALSAPHEVEAWTAAFRGDFVGARDAAQRATRELSGVEEVRTYRSLWLYLAATWSFAATSADPHAGKTGVGLLRQAHLAAQGSTWIRETDAGAVSAVEEDAADTPAVREIRDRLEGGRIKRVDVESAIDRMRSGLGAVDHRKSEPALTEMGDLLGAKAFKPDGQGRADSVWCWDNAVWLVLEAKSEESTDGDIPLRDIRQANTQLQLEETDRGVSAPDMSATIIVSPRDRVVTDGVAAAGSNLFLAHPSTVRELGEQIARCWDRLFTTSPGHTGPDLEALVRRTLAENGVLPSQVYERLTETPIRS